MTKSKIKKIHPFDRLNEWGLHIPMVINTSDIISFDNGISLDIEHDGTGNWVGLGIYDPKDNICYYWSDLKLAKRIRIPMFIAHNGVSDTQHLRHWQFDIGEGGYFYDTFLMQHILDSSQRDYGLKAICKREGIGEWPDYKEIVGKDKTLLDFPVEYVAAYNACDTYYCYKLYEKQSKHLDPDEDICKEADYFHNIEAPVARIFYDMQERGIKIDVEYLKELREYLEDQKEPLELSIKNELGDIV